MKIKQLLEKQAGSFPEKCAIAFENSRISFLEVKEQAFRLAAYLSEVGLAKGDRVAIYLSNTPEAVFSFLGIFSAAAVAVPLDFMLSQAEIITFLNHSQAKLLIAQPRKGIDFQAIKESCPELAAIIFCKEAQSGYASWDDVMASVSSDTVTLPEVSADDLAAIFYTSGSTGQPKGVMLKVKQLNNPPYVINHFLAVSEKDIFLCGGVPFSHVGGLVYILLMVSYASQLVLRERFQPYDFLKQIEEHRVTIFCIVPAMFMAILSLKEYDAFDLSSLRYAAVFGAPSSPAVLRRFHKAYPNAKLCNGWGMTETAAPNTLSPPGDEKIKSIGSFTPAVSVKIADDSGRELKPGQRGELWIKGAAVMPGYFRQESLTKQVLTDDGWLKTGDIAYCDEEGLYYIAGRKKDMIKVAGEIVFLAEVEEKIQLHPKVKEAAVIGVSDNLRGEVAKAYIALNKGDSLSGQELKEFLKEQLAHFKIPHYVEVVGELPKNRTGKIDKTKLS